MKRGFLPFILSAVILLPAPLHGARGGVEGRVLYRGEGMAGVYVEAFDAHGSEGKAVGAANTGSDGSFRISLPPGSYTVRAKKRPEGPGSGGMLYGSSGEDPVEVATVPVGLGPIHLRDLGSAGTGAPGRTTVKGTVYGNGSGLPGAYVYFYPGGTRRGPGYLSRARTGEGGGFTAGLAPGSYTVTVRYGSTGDGMGSVNVGDMVGDHPGNPVTVGTEPRDLGRIDLRTVDPGSWERNRWGGSVGAYAVRGTITDGDGSPMPGVYAFLYDDHRMAGKPFSISAPSGPDGAYEVTVIVPGTYYIGARTRFGGPVEPGEFMGACDEKGIRPLTLDGDHPSATCDIIVREVW